MLASTSTANSSQHNAHYVMHDMSYNTLSSPSSTPERIMLISVDPRSPASWETVFVIPVFKANKV